MEKKTINNRALLSSSGSKIVKSDQLEKIREMISFFV